MRGDLTIQKNETVRGLLAGQSMVIDGDQIGVASAGAGVKVRDSERSFRVAVSGASIKDVVADAQAGDAIPVRFKMTLKRNAANKPVYIMVPAGDKPAQGVIKVRG